MKKSMCLFLIILLSACSLPVHEDPGELIRVDEPFLAYILPNPRTDGTVSVESALHTRRSRRDFQDEALNAQQLSQLLWAAYGITSSNNFRTTPSAGALYPLEIYAIIGNVEGIEPGVYLYDAVQNILIQTVEGDIRAELDAASLNQRMVLNAPLTIFYSAVFARITAHYGQRGIMYTHMEVGHSAQNVYLQAEALGLGTCAIGAFIENTVRELLNLPENETPLYFMPIGYVNE